MIYLTLTRPAQREDLKRVISWPEPTQRPAVPGQSHLQSSAQNFSHHLVSKCQSYIDLPLQNTWNASSADLTSTSIQPATYMLWFWSSLRILDWGGLDRENKKALLTESNIFWGVVLELLDSSHGKLIKYCICEAPSKATYSRIKGIRELCNYKDYKRKRNKKHLSTVEVMLHAAKSHQD